MGESQVQKKAEGQKKWGYRKNLKGYECGGTIKKYENLGDARE